MEGRTHNGVIVATVSNASPSQARAWEQRWRRKRPTEAMSGGTAGNGVAFRVASGYDLGGATHVVIYEGQESDIAAAAESAGSSRAEMTTYTKIAEYGPVTEGRTAGVVLVFTDCTDPAQEDAFNEWYSGHLQHTVESIDFYAATRYVSNDPSRTPSKYLAIYESQSDHPAKVQRDGVEWWEKGGFEGPRAMVLRNEVPAERID